MHMGYLLAQAQGGATKGVDAPADFRQAKAGPGHRGANVGRKQQFHAAARAIAIHGGDDGLAVGAIFQ